MEKLLQLLNEYRLEKGMSEYTKYISETGYFTRKSYFYEHYSWVISKKFGFIQRLTENDKIKDPLPQVLKDIDVVGNDTITGVDMYSTTDSLLMLLAIQDEPIEFLISVLK